MLPPPMRWHAPGSTLRVGGHRGASAFAPENTLASFRLAAASGADYVELDVQRSCDGELVVIHDETLERTTNGRGRVGAADAAVLDGLDAGTWFDPQFAAERVPRLTSVLAWLATVPATGATFEAKGKGTGVGLAGVITAVRDAARLSICSFEPGELRAAAAAGPAIARILIVDRAARGIDLVAAARDAAATGVNVPWDWLDPDEVSRLHHAGLMVAGGTIGREALAQCLALGIDLVDANDPGAVVSALQEAAR
jgi:glycerophosphoryl diester phosphodiesterase